MRTHEDDRALAQHANLHELPRHEALERRPDAPREDEEGLRHPDEVMEAREERAMFVGLANERIYLLLEWQMDADANRAATADADVSAADAPTRTLVATAREDLEIARQTRGLLGVR